MTANRHLIFTVARRVCLDRVRAIRPTESLDDLATPPSTQDVAEQIAHRDELQRLLDSLPPSHREILLLNRYHGLTYREIAEITGTSPVSRPRAAREMRSTWNCANSEAGRVGSSSSTGALIVPRNKPSNLLIL